PSPSPSPREARPGHSAVTPWDVARNVARRAAGRKEGAARTVALDRALGQTLAGALVALTDLPSFDSSAMDGWAVAGPGPWRLPDSRNHPGSHPGILAGQSGDLRLSDGEAVAIATGARVPPGATAVLRSEHGVVRPHGELYADRHLTQGQDVRPRGQECREGDELLPAGVVVTPAVVGLAAASGYDEVPVVPRPRVEVFVLGDELLREGLPHDGRIRDALGPMLGPWLAALGAEVVATRRLGDDASALRAALEASDADLVLTTGGTAAGPVDHVRPTLRLLGAEPLVDGVAVRPGHPMLLARLAPGRHLVGLPGNPLAAVAGLLTLAEPLLRTLVGRPARRPCRAPFTEDVPGHATSTRLVPVVRTPDGYARPLRFHGPAMLRGLAAADALAVVPPGGPGPAREAELLALPWEGDR
ncbi:molybdopterin molybdotransferase MoeA, partial [Streptomyces hesseae]